MTALLGTGALVRLALRRDRILLPVWIVVLVVSAAGSAAATIGLYSSVADRVQLATTVDNTSSLVALYGRIYDVTSLGEVSLFKMGGLGAAMVAVLTLLTVVRHTRTEEESGRLELLGATPVGRYAPLAAALAVAMGTSLVLGLVTALALIGVGLPAAGSVAFGMEWAGVGIAFAALAALAAQLTRSARIANGIAGATLAVVYVLRAVGDTASAGGPTWLSWLSPIGWAQQLRPYAGNRWWALAITLGFAVAATAGAVALAARRDLDAGLIHDRPGPAHASARLRGPFGLAWRLQRGLVLVWTASFVFGGVVIGGLAASVGDFLTGPQAQEFITELGGQQGLINAFLSAELAILAVIASVYGIQAALRMRSEETALHAEPVLATATGRIRWAWSHIVIALAGSAVMLTGAGLAAGVARAADTHDARDIARVLGGALVQVPAVWVLIGIVVALYGLAPRLVSAGWAVLVVFLLLGELGPLLKLRQWAMDLSPFTHVPRLPGAPVTVVPLIWLAVVAAGLTAAGLAGFRRRDIG